MAASRCPAPLTIIIGIVIIIAFMWLVNMRSVDGFVGTATSLPDMEAIMNPKITKDEANEYFRKTLVYIENNPDDTDVFLTFIKSAFFTENALFKSPMNFAGLSGKWDRGFKGHPAAKGPAIPSLA